MPMKNPPHPGLSVRLNCLEPLGLSVTEAAKVLGVTRQAVNNIVNGKSGISPEMAIRLSKAFGSSPETWLGMQLDYDLAQARLHEGDIRVARVRRARSAPHASSLIRALSARSCIGRRSSTMKKQLKKLPKLGSDKEAEEFVANSDLTEYDLSGGRSCASSSGRRANG